VSDDSLIARRLPISIKAHSAAAIAAVTAALVACSGSPLSPYTTAAPPLVLVPAQQAGVQDRRGRFREIYCAVLEAHGHDLPDYRPCAEALTRVGDEPGATGAAVDLGTSKRHLVAAIVPGIGWECFSDWLNLTGTTVRHLQQFGFAVEVIRVGGLSGTDANAQQVRDAVMQQRLDSKEPQVVLIGYSKGAPDVLEALVRYPEIRGRVAAVVSAGGAIGGSPLANSAKQSQADLLRHWPGARCEKGDDKGVESLRPGVRKAWLAHNPLPQELPYYSVVTYPDPDRISSVLRSSYNKLSKIDARNDSQLLFYDEVIPGSTLTAYVNADHWALAVPVNRTHSVIGSMFTTQNAYPREALLEAILRFVEEDLSARSGLTEATQP
jgi:pimeloyl-ACP methyl ester carboxylesterase